MSLDYLHILTLTPWWVQELVCPRDIRRSNIIRHCSFLEWRRSWLFVCFLTCFLIVIVVPAVAQFVQLDITHRCNMVVQEDGVILKLRLNGITVNMSMSAPDICDHCFWGFWANWLVIECKSLHNKLSQNGQKHTRYTVNKVEVSETTRIMLH